MQPARERRWMPLVELESLEECKGFIRRGGIKDAVGDSLTWKWHPTRPGDGKRRVQFVCNSHIDCEVEAKGVKVGGSFWVQMSNDAHGTIQNLKGRSNGAATKDQLAKMVSLIDAGTKPAGILASLTSAELERCKQSAEIATKRVSGGLTGEQSCQSANDTSRNLMMHPAKETLQYT